MESITVRQIVEWVQENPGWIFTSFIALIFVTFGVLIFDPFRRIPKMRIQRWIRKYAGVRWKFNCLIGDNFKDFIADAYVVDNGTVEKENLFRFMKQRPQFSKRRWIFHLSSEGGYNQYLFPCYPNGMAKTWRIKLARGGFISDEGHDVEWWVALQDGKNLETQIQLSGRHSIEEFIAEIFDLIDKFDSVKELAPARIVEALMTAKDSLGHSPLMDKIMQAMREGTMFFKYNHNPFVVEGI